MRIGQMKLLSGIAALAFCVSVNAQTSGSKTDHPTPIGTSQQKADEANAVAVKRGDTATVVRTGPSVGDKAEAAGTTTKVKAKTAKNKVKAKAADATTPQ